MILKQLIRVHTLHNDFVDHLKKWLQGVGCVFVPSGTKWNSKRISLMGYGRHASPKKKFSVHALPEDAYNIRHLLHMLMCLSFH